MKIFFLVITLFFSLALCEDNYQLGEGVQIGKLPLFIGGYISADYKNTEDENRYRLDDISLLAYGSYSRLSYMLEVEHKNLHTKISTQNSSYTEQDKHIYRERLYVEYNFNENYILRVGKYNTPIGYWNLLPINILRETSSSPQSTNILYPKFTTGVGTSYLYYGTGELKVDLIVQDNKDLDTEYNNYQTDKHYGFGISYTKDDYSIKLNGGYFHYLQSLSLDNDLYYLLISSKYETDKYQIICEAGTQGSNNQTTTKYAAYAQGAYHFTEQHTGVMRIESYDKLDKKDNILLVGYTYRPLYPIAIKSEYLFHSESALNEVILSLSVLF